MTGLEHWKRQPYTENDCRWSILMVFCGAAWTTCAAALYAPASNSQKVWLTFAVGNLLFLAGVVWTVMHYRYLMESYQPRLQELPSTTTMVIFTSTDFGGVMGLCNFVTSNAGLYPVAAGMWASLITVMVFHYIRTKRLAESDGSDGLLTGAGNGPW